MDEIKSRHSSIWPSVSVIVPTYRRFRPVLSTLRHLLTQDYVDLEIVVADQNREWPLELQSEFENVRALSNVRWLLLDNPGVVAARNEAVRISRGEILLFIDDDVEIANKRFVRRHAWNYRDREVAAVAGRECGSGRQELADFHWDEHEMPAPGEAIQQSKHFVAGTFIRPRQLSARGGFDILHMQRIDSAGRVSGNRRFRREFQWKFIRR